MSKAFPITNRELERAWRELRRSSQVESRCNSHRLLMVYAVECGLKAVWLRRQRRDLFVGQDIDRFGHDLNEILRELKPGASSSLCPQRCSSNRLRRMSHTSAGAQWRARCLAPSMALWCPPDRTQRRGDGTAPRTCRHMDF